MVNEIVWAVITALIVFSFLLIYKLGERRGYNKGAKQVLEEWKEWMTKIKEDEE